MKLYHGSIEKVESPEIRKSNRTLDYGQGFYTTSSYEQAEAWVKRRMEEKKIDKGYVCVYKLDKRRTKKLKFGPTQAYLDLILDNPKDYYTYDNDIALGQVVDDRLRTAWTHFKDKDRLVVNNREEHMRNVHELLAELEGHKDVYEYIFHTQKALDILTFIEAKEVVL